MVKIQKYLDKDENTRYKFRYYAGVDELTGKQLKDLKAALADEKSGKKGSLLEKIKSFGMDTLSNILANIVTNPAIWG